MPVEIFRGLTFVLSGSVSAPIRKIAFDIDLDIRDSYEILQRVVLIYFLNTVNAFLIAFKKHCECVFVIPTPPPPPLNIRSHKALSSDYPNFCHFKQRRGSDYRSVKTDK